MKQIALISDTHHYIDERFIQYFKEADEIWHAGDIGSLEITEELKKYAPIRVVWGNIDNSTIRSEFKATIYFKCEDVKVMITHIGGYPERYNKKTLHNIKQFNPDLFICGHSHILKVMYDKKYNLLHMNPGAIGNFGIHKVKTILCFTINGKAIDNLRVIEVPRNNS